MRIAIFLLAVRGCLEAAPPEFRAGVSKLDITPEGPIWLSGYASRARPSSGVETRLFAKALAIAGRRGGRAVIVTTDLVGLPRVITDAVAARAGQQYGLRRDQILFNSSHTHTGPVVWPNLSTMYELDDGNRQVLINYARHLEGLLFQAIGGALGNLEPATLFHVTGRAGFAANRRVRKGAGVQFGVSDGPADHSVPVLGVRDAPGKWKALLFGYACHNTTLDGSSYRVSGDYAGYAQAELESAYPGVTAPFLMLCGADQNPQPRSTEEHARSHGRALAAAVRSAIEGGSSPVTGPLRTAYQVTDLAFAVHTREQFEAEARDNNPYRARRAKEMLARYDEGRPIRSTPYPVQAIRFAKGFSLLALGGEVVVDYPIRARKEFPGEPLVMAGYSNDVMCYIPSLRILREGGYEGDTSMMYYGQPGKFSEDVEETIFMAIRSVMKRVGATRR